MVKIGVLPKAWNQRAGRDIIAIMTAETFRSFLQRKPFEPLRVTMSSGQSFEIPHPEMALLTPKGLIIVLPDQNGQPTERIEFCSFLHIASVSTAAFA